MRRKNLEQLKCSNALNEGPSNGDLDHFFRSRMQPLITYCSVVLFKFHQQSFFPTHLHGYLVPPDH